MLQFYLSSQTCATWRGIFVIGHVTFYFLFSLWLLLMGHFATKLVEKQFFQGRYNVGI